MKHVAQIRDAVSQVESMERRAATLAEAEADRRRMQLLESVTARVAALGPTLRDMGHHVTELKAYLQSVCVPEPTAAHQHARRTPAVTPCCVCTQV